MKLFILAFGLSFAALASNWSELEIGETYKLTQNFQLPILERSHSIMDFSKGDELYLKDKVVLPIPGHTMIKFIFAYPSCPGPQIQSDTVVVKVDGTAAPVVRTVIGLEENCELAFYLEGIYFNRESIFE
ncbi:MAG: hypothetical protein AB7I27_08705 [Bacteriovoracaceae bacterium]